MTRVRVSGPARRDIVRILRRSGDEFGPEAADRHRSLLDQALRDLAEDPQRPGVRSIAEVKEHYFAFHLRLSVGRTARPSVRRPRHVIVFRLDPEDEALAARVLHERQLLARHLDDDA